MNWMKSIHCCYGQQFLTDTIYEFKHRFAVRQTKQNVIPVQKLGGDALIKVIAFLDE